MKLSEAIRLGAMEGPQGFWSGSVTSDEKRCAVGAAAWAVGAIKANSRATYEALNHECPLLCTEIAQSDVPAVVSRELPERICGWDVLGVMWRLNDCAKWTREQIADWVETIEAKYEQPAKEQPQPVIVEA
jgi:hypothetical protein